MTESRTRFEVRRALDQLKPYLTAFVAAALTGKEAEALTKTGDLQALLSALLVNWDAIFAKRLSRTARHYAFELKDVRNRWAHEAQFTEDETRRAVDTAAFLAEAIGAPKDVVAAIRRGSEAASPARGAGLLAKKPAARGSSSRRTLSQREMMRRIYAQCWSDEARVIREYAAAEERGEVLRQSNAYDMDAEEYARRLLQDGKKKGWLRSEADYR